MRKVFSVSYGYVGRRTPGGPLQSFSPAFLYTKDYDGEHFATLSEAKAIFDAEAPAINSDADYDEFLPICIEVEYVPDIKGHSCYIANVDYIIYDGESWYVPLKDNAVKRASEEEAKEWVYKYLEAVESYEKRVNAAPAVSLEELMFGGDKAAYPTEEELAAMPKEE